jgi:hypothetical protein
MLYCDMSTAMTAMYSVSKDLNIICEHSVLIHNHDSLSAHQFPDKHRAPAVFVGTRSVVMKRDTSVFIRMSDLPSIRLSFLVWRTRGYMGKRRNSNLGNEHCRGTTIPFFYISRSSCSRALIHCLVINRPSFQRLNRTTLNSDPYCPPTSSVPSLRRPSTPAASLHLRDFVRQG